MTMDAIAILINERITQNTPVVLTVSMQGVQHMFVAQIEEDTLDGAGTPILDLQGEKPLMAKHFSATTAVEMLNAQIATQIQMGY